MVAKYKSSFRKRSLCIWLLNTLKETITFLFSIAIGILDLVGILVD